MSRQYNDMGFLYRERRSAPVYDKEKETVKQILSPIIKGANVLELACGSGFYTYDLSEWGAKHVTGVEISSDMLSTSKRSAGYAKHASRVDFIEADASIPQAYPGGPFDVVLGTWFLNYAPDREAMARMFANISLNLKDGGTFVGVQLPPSDDPVAEYSVGPLISLGTPCLLMEIASPVADGFLMRVHLKSDRGSASFDCYHLSKEAFESAARMGGMSGPSLGSRREKWTSERWLRMGAKSGRSRSSDWRRTSSPASSLARLPRQRPLDVLLLIPS